PGPVVLPSATSNSLTSGTSIAATAKPKAPAMARSGLSGSAVSGEPGLATRMSITAKITASGHAQLATKRADDGLSPFSPHHNPRVRGEINGEKLAHWYSKPQLRRIREMQTAVPIVRKKTVPSA